jgi:hypothetical protein
MGCYERIQAIELRRRSTYMKIKNILVLFLILSCTGNVCFSKEEGKAPCLLCKSYHPSNMTLKVAGYNIKTGGEYKEIRAQLIPDFVKENDIVIFSEAENNQARRILLAGMKKCGFSYASCVIGSGYKKAEKRTRNAMYTQPYTIDFMDNRFSNPQDEYGQGGDGDNKEAKNGGIIIVSKHQIKDAREWIYYRPESSSIHPGIRWPSGLKGVVYVKIIKDNKVLHVFGTHTEARYSTGSFEKVPTITIEETIKIYHEIISDQMKQLGNFIKSFKISKTEPIIVGGDFNINRYDNNIQSFKNQIELYNALLSNTAAIMPDLENPIPPYNDFNGLAQAVSKKPRQIDYVFASRYGLEPKQTDAKYLGGNTEKPFDKEGKRKSLSDHPILEAEFVFDL